jgi:hypothetical protein
MKLLQWPGLHQLPQQMEHEHGVGKPVRAENDMHAIFGKRQYFHDQFNLVFLVRNVIARRSKDRRKLDQRT